MRLKWILTMVSLLCVSLTLKANQETTVIEITSDDTMRYNVTALEVPAGKPVTLVFKNLGKLPKAAMGHNVVILQPGSNVASFGTAAIGAAANDYIPTDASLASQMVAHTKMLGPDEEDRITFTLPAPGDYPFLCSFPGHFALMQGIITAQ